MDIDIGKGRARVEAYGRLRPESAVDFALVALMAARARGLRTLLFAFDNLRLTRPLSAMEGRCIAVRLAQAGRGIARAAFVVPADCEWGVEQMTAAATSRGLTAAAFCVEAHAQAWLDEAGAPSP